jgi:predicted acyl esterase
VYRPAQNGKVVEGKFPVILERTPYGKDNDVYYANHWVKQGYVVILQDVRGRFDSEGVWRFFRDDINSPPERMCSFSRRSPSRRMSRSQDPY